MTRGPTSASLRGESGWHDPLIPRVLSEFLRPKPSSSLSRTGCRDAAREAARVPQPATRRPQMPGLGFGSEPQHRAANEGSFLEEVCFAIPSCIFGTAEEGQPSVSAVHSGHQHLACTLRNFRNPTKCKKNAKHSQALGLVRCALCGREAGSHQAYHIKRARLLQPEIYWARTNIG